MLGSVGRLGKIGVMSAVGQGGTTIETQTASTVRRLELLNTNPCRGYKQRLSMAWSSILARR